MRIVSVQFLTPVLFGGQTLTRALADDGWMFSEDGDSIRVAKDLSFRDFLQVPRVNCVLRKSPEPEFTPPVAPLDPIEARAGEIARTLNVPARRKRAKDATE